MKKIGILACRSNENGRPCNNVPFEYVSFVESAWALPVIVACNSERIGDYVYDLDGFVFPGGSDIDPALFGMETETAESFSRETDAFLFRFLHRAIREGKPVLGISKGMLLINAYFWGTLVQNLSDADFHNRPDMIRDFNDNAILEKTGLLYESFRKEFVPINSAHRQGVGDLWNGLMVTARSEHSGSIEALEHGALPVFGVQWNPECLPSHVPIMRTFVSKCQDLISARRVFC